MSAEEVVAGENPATPLPDLPLPDEEGGLPAESFWKGLSRMPRTVWVVALGLFINRLGTMIWPMLTLYVEKNHGSGAASPVLASLGLGGLAASLLAGHAADTLGRRVCVLASSFSAAIVALALSQAHSLVALMILTGALGFTTSMGWPGLNALVAEAVPVSRRPQAVALSRLSVNLGFALGPSLAGWLAASSFFLVFACDSLTWFLFGLIAWLGLPVKEVVQRDWGRFRQVLPSLAEAFRVAGADRAFVRFLGAQLLVALLFMQFSTTLSLVMRDAGCSTVEYGLVMGLNGLVIVLLEVPLTARAVGFSVASRVALGALLFAVSLSAAPLVSGVAAFAVLMVVLTVGEMLWIPAASVYIANAATDELRGRYQGLSGFTWALAGVVGPASGVALYHASPAAWSLGSLLLGFGAVWLAWSMKPGRQALAA